MKAARGNVTVNLALKRQNFALCFGCKPSQGVLAETKMVYDVVKILLEEYDRTTFAVQFTDCFNDLKGSDANFEMVASNTLQPVKMFYRNNIATSSAAAIFVHNKAISLPYNEAKERAELHKRNLEDVLGFEEVKVYTDPTN